MLSVRLKGKHFLMVIALLCVARYNSVEYQCIIPYRECDIINEQVCFHQKQDTVYNVSVFMR